MFLHRVLATPPSQPIGESASVQLSELMGNSGNFDSSLLQDERMASRFAFWLRSGPKPRWS